MYGLYLHIPFCASRCIYCGFYSTTHSQLMDRYVDALCKEMELRKNYLPANTLRTVYFGGGTPSMLSSQHLLQLFEHINKVFDTQHLQEVTIECNPDDVTPAFASMLRSLPVNRVSLGAQTFSDERLRFLRRRHNAAETAKAVSLLRKTGIGNISIDLMFGFPRQTVAEWAADLDNAVALGVEHLSAYSLMYEESTPLYRMLLKGEIEEIEEETSRQMYYMLIDRLEQAGYEQYEISNFARSGHRSRHNSSYWQAVPYMGLGASAHSYDCRSRQWNVENLKTYVEAIEQNRIPMEMETLTPETTYNDLITTTLRTREGIDLSALSTVFERHFMQCAQKYIATNLLEVRGNRAKLTRQGLYVSDAVMSDLMFV